MYLLFFEDNWRFHLGVNAKGKWYFSDIRPSCETDVRSSLRADFTAFLDKCVCVDYLNEAQTMADDVFKLALYGLNTLDEKLERMEGVAHLHRSPRLSEAPIQFLERQLSAHPAEL